MAKKDADLNNLVESIGKADEGEGKEFLLSEIDPADGSAEVRKNKDKPDVFDGTKAEELPEAPVDVMHAAGVLAKRAWEREQGKQAEIPDN